MEKLTIHNRNDIMPVSYDIVWKNTFDDLSAQIQAAGLQPGKICILTDTNVDLLYGDAVEQALQEMRGSKLIRYAFPAGERSKNLHTIAGMYDFLIAEGFDRGDLLIALGGGVTGDVAGFCAATYMRGLAYIQVPTTLLAQVDSSVGGKTGVDVGALKNMVGAFYPPRLVYMNIQTLATLPQREFQSGMGEVIKTGLLRDGSFFSWLEEEKDKILAKDSVILKRMIHACCRNKAAVVEEDPAEKGLRATLNLGHTLGHAIEKCSDFSLSHGAAIGIGTIAAAWLSVQRGLLTPAELQRIKNIEHFFGIPEAVSGMDPGEIVHIAHSDKKMKNGQIQFVLLKGIGHAILDATVTEEEMLQAASSVTNR